MAKFVCNYPWTHFEVNNPNGDVTMCCDNSIVLGNVNENTTDEIWNGDKFQDIRRRMKEHGAHAICPHTCPVLHGFKTHQNLDWYKEMAPESEARKNAEVNEAEFADGKVVLQSMPRWMRYTYSYKCNLDCYHCYQREDDLLNHQLPDRFMAEIYEKSRFYQVLFFFGGEPFLFKPVTQMIEDIDLDPDSKLFLITNGTLLTPKVKEKLEASNSRSIGMFAVSLDAANGRSFDKLRVRGRNASWDTVMKNLDWIADLKRRKDFFFEISMTVNSQNASEIEAFVDIGLERGAQPLLLLVSNPFQTEEFQKDYLHFTDEQFDEMEGQIARSIVKVRAYGFKDAEAALVRLRGMLKEHRRTENNVMYYRAKTVARKAFRTLPKPLQYQIRRLLA